MCGFFGAIHPRASRAFSLVAAPGGVRWVSVVTVLGLVGGAPGGETPRVAVRVGSPTLLSSFKLLCLELGCLANFYLFLAQA